MIDGLEKPNVEGKVFAGLPKAKITCLDDKVLPEADRSMVVQLVGAELIVGRGAEAGIILRSNQISRIHARLFAKDGAWWVEDLKSTNGISVNDSKTDLKKLAPDDLVSFGPILFRYEIIETDKKEHSAEETLFGSPDQPLEDATMMFSDAGSGRAMMEALDKKEKDTQELAIKGISTVDEFLPEIYAEEGKAYTYFKNILKFLVFIAIVAGGFWGSAYYYQNVFKVNLMQESLLRKYSENIMNFISDNNWSAEFDEKANKEQLATLDKMSREVDNAVSKNPEMISLKFLRYDLMIIKLVRELRYLYELGQTEQAFALIKSVEEKINKEFGLLEDNEAGRVSQKLIEFINILKQLKIVSKYRLFAQRFPDPDAVNETELLADLKAEIYEIKELRHEFTALRKLNNISLSVKFRYLDGMLDDIEQHLLPLVNKWHDSL